MLEFLADTWEYRRGPMPWILLINFVIILIFVVFSKLKSSQKYGRNFQWVTDDKSLTAGAIGIVIGSIFFVMYAESGEARKHYNLGVNYYNQGRINLAIIEFKEAIRINQNYTDAHYNLGFTYQNQGKLDEATTVYKEAIRIDPNKVDVHNNLGIVYRQQGKFDEAIDSYKQVININPNVALSHSNLGNAYADKGMLDEAIDSYQKAIEINPNFAQPHNNLGFAYYQQRKFDEAIAAYQSAIGINTSFSVSRFRYVEDDEKEFEKSRVLCVFV